MSDVSSGHAPEPDPNIDEDFLAALVLLVLGQYPERHLPGLAREAPVECCHGIKRNVPWPDWRTQPCGRCCLAAAAVAVHSLLFQNPSALDKLSRRIPKSRVPEWAALVKWISHQPCSCPMEECVVCFVAAQESTK